MNTTTNIVKQAYGYCRISKEKNKHQDLSIDLQKERITQHAKMKGWMITKFFVDEGISGSSTQHRNQFTKMMQQLDGCDAIIVYKLDRFARNLKDLLNTINTLQQKNIEFVSTTEQFDTSTAMGKFALNILGAAAQLGSDLVSDRMMDVMISRRNHGIMHNKPPLGYSFKNGTLQPNQDAIKVKEIFSKRGNDVGVTQLSREYNLSRYQVYYILKNRTYTGKIKNDNGLWIKGKHQPIITEEMFQKAQPNSLAKVYDEKGLETGVRNKKKL